MIQLPQRRLLLVVSAPSGAGKTTLCERLRSEFHDMTYSVSCTTRSPRDGEVNDVNYTFLTEADFQRRIDADEFLEHAVVHGNHYGTLRSRVRAGLSVGLDVLMDIDVQGAAQIRANLARSDAPVNLKQALVDIFIAPPSMDVLQRRLRLRGKDADDVIARRLKQAEAELARWQDYRYLIVNDRLDAAYDALRSIVLAERHRILA